MDILAALDQCKPDLAQAEALPVAEATAILRWALVALLLALGSSHSFAQQRNPGVAQSEASEQRTALVIGNSAYKEAPLRNPVNDASDMAATLRSLGFTVTLRTNADTRQMRAAIREFAQNLKRGGVGLFYFAGHGVQSRNGRNYLIPVGADLKEEFELEDEAVDANRVLAGMEEAGNRVNIVILDACRNNPFARSWRSAVNGLAQMSAPAGSFVGFATAPGQVAADGTGRNGMYTKYLLENLKAGDPNIDRVFTRVTAAVAKETGNKQVPWKSSSLTGDFYFRSQEGGAQAVSAAPATPTPVEPSVNDWAFWDSVKDSKNPEELKAYLEQFPRGLFIALAQTRLRALQSTQVATAPPSVPAASSASASGSIASMSPGTVFRDCVDCPEVVVIPSGKFNMGSPANEAGRMDREGPQHAVAIPSVFGVGKYEVTKAQFSHFVKESDHSAERGCVIFTNGKWTHDKAKGWRNPGYSQTDNEPVVCVNWNDAKAYTEWLTKKTGKRYRLLTESEWEYAARAGRQTSRPWGDNANDACRYANVADASAKRDVPEIRGAPFHNCDDGRAYTAPVGSYQPNAFGLYDMIGNAWEWTADCYKDNYTDVPSDGSAWASGMCDRRVARGGSWSNTSERTRSTNRGEFGTSGRYYVVGFRVARTD